MSKIKLTRKQINIKVNDCLGISTNAPIVAWVYNDLLAWHKSVNGSWTLTHAPTGYKIGDFQGKYNQLREVTSLLTLLPIDWSESKIGIILAGLKSNTPYDLLGFIQIVLCDVVDIDPIMEMLEQGQKFNDIVDRTHKLFWS